MLNPSLLTQLNIYYTIWNLGTPIFSRTNSGVMKGPGVHRVLALYNWDLENLALSEFCTK